MMTVHPRDEAAQGWNRHAAMVRSWLAEAPEAMLAAARMAPGSRVLYIAVGAADQTLDIARRVGPQGHVLATDISAATLALADANARAAGLPQVETRVADAEALGLGGAGFDAAACRLGLMFCRAPLAALAGARAALRPGGRFCALVFSEPQHSPCPVTMMAVARRHAGLHAPSPFEPGTLLSLGAPGRFVRLLDAAGFVDIQAQRVSAPYRPPTSADDVEFVRTVGSPIMQMLAPLPAAAQRDAWNEMRTKLNVFTTPDGWVGPNELLLCNASAPP